MTTHRGWTLLGTVLLIAGATGAEAADLYGGRGSIKDVAYAPVMEAPRPAWYFRADAGYAVHDEPTMVENGIFDLIHTGIKDTWTVGGGIGTYFSRNIRGDVTFDYRAESDAHGRLVGAHPVPGMRHFGIESGVFLANLYYDFDFHSRIQPYIGVGLGFAHHRTKAGTVDNPCGCDGTIEASSNYSVAAALMAGFSVNLTNRNGGAAYGYGHGGGYGGAGYGGSTKDAPVVVADTGRNLYLDVGYRFLYLGDTSTGPVRANINGVPQQVSEDPTVENMHAHEFRVGLRYDLR